MATFDTRFFFSFWNKFILDLESLHLLDCLRISFGGSFFSLRFSHKRLRVSRLLLRPSCFFFSVVSEEFSASHLATVARCPFIYIYKKKKEIDNNNNISPCSCLLASLRPATKAAARSGRDYRLLLPFLPTLFALIWRLAAPDSNLSAF